ncbi:conserved hypothetical protein [Desulfosarcina cetonica]|uniref:hypothetical protein n=1 Tax=Desulfosarcina cetonica TaxID=90730 RepID=UPI0006D2846D|nr:hypothetical protein [Desulfosarcina cetonica]VTR64539.1 conserved hypothetical protein [Desulfosarcina cetonica]
MPLIIFDDVYFGSENAAGRTCTRVIWDNEDGSTEYDNLKIYRFGDRGKSYDWTSPERQKTNGNFARPSDFRLNQMALSQVRFGRGGIDTGPFVSVATSHEALHSSHDPWVQKILQSAPDLGVLVVPFATLMRPSINSEATKKETEWLYFDGGAPLTDYLQSWLPNPYKD